MEILIGILFCMAIWGALTFLRVIFFVGSIFIKAIAIILGIALVVVVLLGFGLQSISEKQSSVPVSSSASRS